MILVTALVNKADVRLEYHPLLHHISKMTVSDFEKADKRVSGTLPHLQEEFYVVTVREMVWLKEVVFNRDYTLTQSLYNDYVTFISIRAYHFKRHQSILMQNKLASEVAKNVAKNLMFTNEVGSAIQASSIKVRFIDTYLSHSFHRGKKDMCK